MYDYDGLKQLAKEQGCKVSDLLALSAHNDPFYVGSTGQVEGARWFADLYRRFYGSESGVHLRRIHYRIVSQDPPVAMPSGEPYLNTEGCWDFLTAVSKYARYLKLVDVDAFTDKRNQEPIVNGYFYRWNDEDPGQRVSGDWRDGVEALALPDLPGLPDLPALPELPALEATGYDVQQPYLIELWVEKTTMNDVLLPLCREYSCNLVTGAGELSITAVRAFLKRAERAGRPARILYISDFDPAGLGMPISIARKIEFYQRNDYDFRELDIALQPIILTEDQVADYDLPRVPVKDSDLRKARFEAGHGEGQVELDALEALYPGRLAQIVEREIMRYYDPELGSKAEAAKGELQAELDERTGGARDDMDYELDGVQSEYAALVRDYQATQAAFAELIAPFLPQLEVYRERLADLRSRAEETYGDYQGRLAEAGAEVDLDEFAAPDAECDGDPDGVLYESTRDYFDQLEAYKAQRDGALS